MFLLASDDGFCFKVFGIYDDYIKAETDCYNVKKYCCSCSASELCIYELDVNKFYSDEDFEQIV